MTKNQMSIIAAIFIAVGIYSLFRPLPYNYVVMLGLSVSACLLAFVAKYQKMKSVLAKRVLAPILILLSVVAFFVIILFPQAFGPITAQNITNGLTMVNSGVIILTLTE